MASAVRPSSCERLAQVVVVVRIIHISYILWNVSLIKCDLGNMESFLK